VHLADALVVRVAVVVEYNDLESPPRQLGRRHVEHELFLELRTQRSTVYAALQLAAPVRQQAQPTERVGGAAKLARYQVSSLNTRTHGRYNGDSTSIRRPFDCLSKVIKVTVT